MLNLHAREAKLKPIPILVWCSPFYFHESHGECRGIQARCYHTHLLLAWVWGQKTALYPTQRLIPHGYWNECMTVYWSWLSGRAVLIISLLLHWCYGKSCCSGFRYSYPKVSGLSHCRRFCSCRGIKRREHPCIGHLHSQPCVTAEVARERKVKKVSELWKTLGFSSGTVGPGKGLGKNEWSGNVSYCCSISSLFLIYKKERFNLNCLYSSMSEHTAVIIWCAFWDLNPSVWGAFLIPKSFFLCK